MGHPGRESHESALRSDKNIKYFKVWKEEEECENY